MVKQNKQINDQNSYQLKAQKKGEQRTSKQAKKNSLSDLKEKSAKAQVNSKQNISKEFKKIMAKEKNRKKKKFNTAKKMYKQIK